MKNIIKKVSIGLMLGAFVFTANPLAAQDAAMVKSTKKAQATNSTQQVNSKVAIRTVSPEVQAITAKYSAKIDQLKKTDSNLYTELLADLYVIAGLEKDLAGLSSMEDHPKASEARTKWQGRLDALKAKYQLN